MKTLSSALEGAQRSLSSRPYVEALLADYGGYARRTDFVQHYAGAEDVEAHAAVIAADGSLVRARVDSGTLYVSRVASPAPGSTFSAWSSVSTDVSNVSESVALCVSPATDRIFLFFARANPNQAEIRQLHSDDHGASWSGLFTVETAAANVQAMAAAVASNGNILLVYSHSNDQLERKRSQSTGGNTWGSTVAATVTFDSIGGLAAAFLVDWQVLVTGQREAAEDGVTVVRNGVYATRFGFGGNLTDNTWGEVRAIAEASFESSNIFTRPFVTYTAEGWWAFFRQSRLGAQRVWWTTMALAHDFNDEQWREPAPFDLAGTAAAMGLAAAAAATRLWAASPSTVWSTLLPAHAALDVSAAVVRAQVDAEPEGATALVELDNADGAYTGWGAGDLAVLRPGARLQLSPGYRTATNEVAAERYTYWVESVELVTGARPRLVLRARDAWSLLAQWRARRQLTWDAGEKTISQLLLYLAARAGLTFTAVSASSALTTVEPAFTVHPGEAGISAVRRLLAMVSDAWRTDETGFVGLDAQDSDAPSYALGGDGEHVVAESRYRFEGPEVNAAKVIGAGYATVPGEAFDWAALQAQGERLRQAVDVAVDASGAEDLAEAIIRKSQLGARSDEVRLFGVHCGVELWDVVELTDARAGIEAAPRRVRGYAWRFEPERGRYDMALTLGAV